MHSEPYKYIKFNPAKAEAASSFDTDKQDELIQAGLQQQSFASDLDKTCANRMQIPREQVLDAGLVRKNSFDFSEELKVSTSFDSPEKISSEGCSSESRHKPKNEQNYEQTLEDLQTVDMPPAQKLVIAIAILLIIVAVGYYFIFMS